MCSRGSGEGVLAPLARSRKQAGSPALIYACKPGTESTTVQHPLTRYAGQAAATIVPKEEATTPSGAASSACSRLDCAASWRSPSYTSYKSIYE